MPTPENADKKEWVIVAEDSAPNRRVLVLLLRRLGFEVIECDDGDTAWQALQSKGDKHVVAILSDLMMPKMDGLQLLRRVRNSAATANLPFVLITAVSDKDYIFEAKSLKADGYLLKPITYQRLLSKMSELFPEREFPSLAS